MMENHQSLIVGEVNINLKVQMSMILEYMLILQIWCVFKVIYNNNYKDCNLDHYMSSIKMRVLIILLIGLMVRRNTQPYYLKNVQERQLLLIKKK
jgi:hypothetical protein